MLHDSADQVIGYQFLEFDRPPDPALDRLARLAVRALHTPMALITILVANQQQVCGSTGFINAIREHSLVSICCQAVVAQAAPVIINDVKTHTLLQHYPAFPNHGMGAYLGMPLMGADGVVRGTVSVIDRLPRSWNDDECDTLRDLVQVVLTELDHHAATQTRFAELLAVQTTKALLATIDRQLPLVVWTTDTELRLTGLFGSGIPDMPSDPTPFLEQPVSAYFATTGASSTMMQASLKAHQQALAGHTGAYQRELGGHSAVVQIEPLRDPNGQIIGCLGSNLPLTAPMRMLQEVQAGRDRLQTLSTQLLHAQEAERRTIARELHDQIGQELTILQLNLQDLLDLDAAQLPAQVELSISAVERVLAQVRDMALNLRPSQLDDLGLAEALRWYLERQAIRGRLKLIFDLPSLTPRPPADVETTCFRIAQEAMTNILRSAHATHVWITITCDANELTLCVRDDGRGFNVAAARAKAVRGTSLGLLSMEERASLIGGRIMIESAPDQGTTVRAWLPLR